jgi:phytoene desaturase
MKKNDKKVIIVGAGIGGLAAAAFLGKEGFDVTILEKNKTIGGRARVFRKEGFTFDMGPSWYMMPEVFEKFFNHFNITTKNLLNLKRLDPNYAMFFGPLEKIEIRKDFKNNLKIFENLERGSSKKITEYLKQAKIMYQISMDKFLYRHYDSVFNVLNKDFAIKGSRLNILQNLDSFISKFTKNEKIKKILEYTIVFLGGSPFNTPALYAILSHADLNLGIFYPMGGIGKLIDALKKIVLQNKVKIKTNHIVKKFVIDQKGYIKSIRTNRGIFSADIIISNADLPFTEINLLPSRYQTYPKSFWNKKTIAPSAFIIYLGIKGRVKNLSHHNIIIANNWHEHFKEIFASKKNWPDKPSYYVCAPSKTDSSIAPKDCENIFILVPVAPGLKDSDKIRSSFSDKIILDFENITSQKIHNRVLYKRIYSHRDFIEDYNSYKGTALGLNHTLLQSAFFRPQNKSKKVKNLYYVGQYTQPGIGMPMCLISAELVFQRIIKDQT